MKTFVVSSVLVILGTTQAQANCPAAALWAAEAAYSNYIHRTTIRTVVPDVQYLVTVGIGNQEDGPHTYRVTFRDNICNPNNAQVCDVTQPGYGPSSDCPANFAHRRR